MSKQVYEAVLSKMESLQGKDTPPEFLVLSSAEYWRLYAWISKLGFSHDTKRPNIHYGHTRVISYKQAIAAFKGKNNIPSSVMLSTPSTPSTPAKEHE